jgi:hypothetical protein
MSSWIDPNTDTPLLAEKARSLDSFLAAIADGKVTDEEVAEQESRVVSLMKQIEPQLASNPKLHDQVTQLLVELTAYDMMQIMNMMRNTRPTKVKLKL